VYRSWLAIGVAGLLGGGAVLALFAGFETPPLFAVAAGSALGAVLAYRYAASRMVSEVHAGVSVDERGDGPGNTDRETAANAAATADTRADGGDYDDWNWADAATDDPFWSTDEADWEDPWTWERTDPSEAAGGRDWTDWQRRERTDERGRWWDGVDDDGEAAAEDDGATDAAAAAAVLGVDRDADPETVREAYRERVKETHPDTEGGSVEAFLRVRQAYECLRERWEE
jgi:hypothetical protein